MWLSSKFTIPLFLKRRAGLETCITTSWAYFSGLEAARLVNRGEILVSVAWHSDQATGESLCLSTGPVHSIA